MVLHLQINPGCNPGWGESVLGTGVSQGQLQRHTLVGDSGLELYGREADRRVLSQVIM